MRRGDSPVLGTARPFPYHARMMKQIFAAFLMAMAFSPALGAEENEGGIGYTGYRIQLTPIMAPYMTPNGLRYEVLTVRLRLPEGSERPGCWMIPIVHEKILMYLYDANLTQADFQGQRRDVLTKNMFDAVIRASDRSLYTGLTLVDANSEPITPETDPRSATLSTQCR